jgi:hypothetical protein
MMVLHHIFGQGGQIALPAQSPDLNPLDCYVWRHLKSAVYAIAVSDLHDMQQKIQNGLEMTCTTLGIVMQVTLQKSNDLH